VHYPLRHTLAMLLLIVTLLDVEIPATHANQDEESSPADLVRQLPGLNSAIARRYVSVDFFAGFPVPTPAGTTPGIESSITRVEVTVLEFDNSVIVTSAFATMLNDELVAGLVGHHDSTIESRDIDNLGDRARYYLVGSGQDDDLPTGFLVEQDANLAFLITAKGKTADLVPTVRAFADYMLAAEPGTGDVVYGDTANSTGGTFDLLPPAEEAPFLGFLIPMDDYDLLNIGNSPVTVPATPSVG